MTREATTLQTVHARLLTGGWQPVCRANAESLLRDGYVVEVKTFMRQWTPLEPTYVYKARMMFRAKERT